MFLTAPLATTAGGLDKCDHAIYENAEDSDYQSILTLLTTAVTKAWQCPRRDLKALKPARQLDWITLSENSRARRLP